MERTDRATRLVNKRWHWTRRTKRTKGYVLIEFFVSYIEWNTCHSTKSAKCTFTTNKQHLPFIVRLSYPARSTISPIRNNTHSCYMAESARVQDEAWRKSFALFGHRRRGPILRAPDVSRWSRKKERTVLILAIWWILYRSSLLVQGDWILISSRSAFKLTFTFFWSIIETRKKNFAYIQLSWPHPWSI